MAAEYKKDGSYPYGVPQHRDDDEVPYVYSGMDWVMSYLFFHPYTISEGKPEVNNVEAAKKLCKYFPSGSSTKAWIHWQQMALSEKPFSMFDYGSPELNREKYGQDVAPEYDYGLITKEINIMFGTDDRLTPPEDIDILVEQLKAKKVKYNMRVYEGCGH